MSFLIKDKKSLFFRLFFEIIIAFIVAFIIIMLRTTKEDFSFKMGVLENFSSDWYCENTGEIIDCPNTISSIEAGEELIISKELPQNLNSRNCLDFRAYQEACKVYIDGELREEYDDADYRKFSKYPPSAEIFVDLTPEDAGKTVKIVYLCDSKYYVGKIDTITIGEKDTILRKMLKKYLPMIIIAFFLVILGFICVIVFYFLYRESKKNKFLVYLGMFITIIGLWMFSSSRIRQFFIGNITVIQYLELWCVHIIPIPFIFFCDLRCGGRYRKFSNVILTICYVDFLVTNLLHFTGLYDKAYMLSFGHICCVITIIYFIICNILEYRTGYKREAIQIMSAFTFLIVLTVVDVAMLYVDRKWSIGFLIVIGIVGFSFILLASSIQDYILESRNKMAIIAEGEAKEQFFASMSHDIRTPINAIIGMNEMIQRESKESETLEYSKDIQRASDTLLSIVNNILDFSKIRDGKYEIIKEKFNFSPMVADVIKMTSTLADKKGLDFKITIDEKIPTGFIGDENALKRILINLISNAIKYTNEGSVEVIAKLNAKDENQNEACIGFEIKDTGIGIKEEDIPHIFEVFSRMDGEKNKNIQGTGLGLAITGALINSMDSKINVRSVYGEGSSFFFEVWLPIVDAEPIGEFSIDLSNINPIEGKDNASTEDSKEVFFDDTKSILIVDDTEMNLKVMSKLLKLNGLNVVTAQSGDECIKKVSSEKFDIILLDDMMPVKDGRETFTELKNTKANRIKGIPIIILTANAGPGVKDMYLSLGFTDYMSKPVNPDKLNEILWKYLG